MTKASKKRIRVLIADDHAVLRSGLRLLIEKQPDMECVGEASDGEEAIRKVRELPVDVMLLDLTMPKMGGSAVLSRLKDFAENIRILVLTMHGDVSYLRSALALGAAGYVVKHAADRELLDAIRAVHGGELYVDGALSKELLDEALVNCRKGGLSEEGASGPRLSGRELEVLQFVAQGFSGREIAERIGISSKTVDTYRARISEKLGLRTRADIIRYCLETGLLHQEQSRF